MRVPQLVRLPESLPFLKARRRLPPRSLWWMRRPLLPVVHRGTRPAPTPYALPVAVASTLPHADIARYCPIAGGDAVCYRRRPHSSLDRLRTRRRTPRPRTLNQNRKRDSVGTLGGCTTCRRTRRQTSHASLRLGTREQHDVSSCTSSAA